MKRERVPVKGGQRRRDPRQPSRVVEVSYTDNSLTGNVYAAVNNIITCRRSYIRVARLETWEVVPC
jgi:hypothetical protein